MSVINWRYLPAVGMTTLAAFGIIGVPLTVLLDSPWPALIIIAPFLAVTVALMVEIVIGVWKDALR